MRFGYIFSHSLFKLTFIQWITAIQLLVQRWHDFLSSKNIWRKFIGSSSRRGSRGSSSRSVKGKNELIWVLPIRFIFLPLLKSKCTLFQHQYNTSVIQQPLKISLVCAWTIFFLTKTDYNLEH